MLVPIVRLRRSADETLHFIRTGTVTGNEIGIDSGTDTSIQSEIESELEGGTTVGIRRETRIRITSVRSKSEARLGSKTDRRKRARALVLRVGRAEVPAIRTCHLPEWAERLPRRLVSCT
ncbi:hypothetical protein EVAR_87027_1 [Eumeta japonica]|uniref:Uncharacterized protein n=1 Tax=Eumeta variegata TaxID=151549 RepID=A0A4C1Z2X7_EUMVA|nr:hypothetical protein EVAR_87027_1 [Eumeta japonica]